MVGLSDSRKVANLSAMHEANHRYRVKKRSINVLMMVGGIALAAQLLASCGLGDRPYIAEPSVSRVVPPDCLGWISLRGSILTRPKGGFVRSRLFKGINIYVMKGENVSRYDIESHAYIIGSETHSGRKVIEMIRKVHPWTWSDPSEVYGWNIVHFDGVLYEKKWRHSTNYPDTYLDSLMRDLKTAVSPQNSGNQQR